MSYIHTGKYQHYTVTWDRIAEGDFILARRAKPEFSAPDIDIIIHTSKTDGFGPSFPFPFHSDPMLGFVFGEVLRKWRNIIWVRDYFGNEVSLTKKDELIRLSSNVTTLMIKS